MKDTLLDQRTMGDRRQRVLGSYLFAQRLGIETYEDWRAFILEEEIPFVTPSESTYETIREWADEWEQERLADAEQFFIDHWRDHRRSMRW